MSEPLTTASQDRTLASTVDRTQGQPPSEPPKGNNRSLDFAGWKAILLFAAIIAIVFFPILFQNRTILFSASEQPSIMSYGAYYGNVDKTSRCSDRTADSGAPAWNIEPWMKMTGDLYKSEGCVPIWNQYSGCGAPYLANMQSQVLFPLMAVFSLFSGSWAHDIFLLTRLLVSGALAFVAFRMYAPGKAALVGAAAYMLTGYQLILIGMPEISVSIVLPLLMLGTELVIREQTFRASAVCVAGVALTLLGGMPELAFIELVMSGLYALTRLTVVAGWNQKLKVLGWLAGAYAGGLLAAAPQVFTFVEYIPYSMNIHDPSNVDGLISGIVGDADWVRGVMSYVWPAAFVVPYFPRGFFGTVAGVLALAGFFYGITRKPSPSSNASIQTNASAKTSAQQAQETTNASIIRVAAWFYGFMTVAMILKRFACPLVNWVGYLPVAKMVYFAKYDEPLIGFCIAALVAIGAGAALKRELGFKLIAGSVVTFVAASAGIVVWYHMVPHGADQDSHRLFLRAMYVSGGMVAATAALILCVKRWAKFAAVAAILLLALVSFDAYYSFIGRVYTAKNLPSRNLDPYKGAPFVDYLQTKVTNDERMTGLSYLFIPEWSGAFQLKDNRSLDAMYPSGILTFWHNLLPDEVFSKTGFPEFWERYFGGELSITRAVTDPSERVRSFHRLAALSSSKYVVTARDLLTEPSICAYNQMETPPNHKTFFKECVIAGKESECLMQHPEKDPKPGEVRFFAVIPTDATLFSFDIIRNPNPDGMVNDEGVHFNLEVGTKPDTWTPIFSEFFNPTTTEGRLKPEPHTVDMSQFAGKRVWLRFSVKSGPKDSWPNEWIAWHHMRWHNAQGQPPMPVVRAGSETLVYDKDVKIYEISPVLARASVLSGVKLANDPKEVLSTLRSDTFDPFKYAVVNQQELSPSQKDALRQFTSSDLTQKPSAVSAKITQSTSRKVSIQLPAGLQQPSVLLLTDTFYPGWKAMVDGVEVPVIKANYSFRAIVLPANAKHVEYFYDPISYRLGTWLSIIAMFALVLGLALEFLIMKRPTKLS